MKVRTLSNRGRTCWIIESTEIEGHPELPLWKDRWSYFCGWDIYLKGTQTKTRKFTNTYLSIYLSLPPSSIHPWCLIHTPAHTHMEGTDIKGSDPFQKRLRDFKRNIVFPSLCLSFHFGSTFAVHFCFMNCWFKISYGLLGSILVFKNQFDSSMQMYIFFHVTADSILHLSKNTTSK